MTPRNPNVFKRHGRDVRRLQRQQAAAKASAASYRAAAEHPDTTVGAARAAIESANAADRVGWDAGHTLTAARKRLRLVSRHYRHHTKCETRYGLFLQTSTRYLDPRRILARDTVSFGRLTVTRRAVFWDGTRWDGRPGYAPFAIEAGPATLTRLTPDDGLDDNGIWRLDTRYGAFVIVAGTMTDPDDHENTIARLVVAPWGPA